MGRAKYFPSFALQLYELGHWTSKYFALQKTLPQAKKKKAKKEPPKQQNQQTILEFHLYVSLCFKLFEFFN